MSNSQNSFRILANAIPLDVTIVDANGNQIVSFGGAGGTSSAFAAPFPAQGTAAGFKDAGGNMVAGNLDAGGNLKVVSSGGGGGPVTVADGADVTQGAQADAAWSGAGSGSVVAILKKIVNTLLTLIGVFPVKSATSTVTFVAAAASSNPVLASNANRLGFVVYNDSQSAVYVKLGATASATSFTRRLFPGDQFSTADVGVDYTGTIDAIWDDANGFMRVTELTA